jgi:serine O-acetyltransferase
MTHGPSMTASLTAADDKARVPSVRESMRDVADQLKGELGRLLDDYAPPLSVALSAEQRADILANAQDQAVADLAGLLRRDPAARQSSEYVLGAYKSFRAVLLHRLAHQLVLQSLRETSPRPLADALAHADQPLPPADPGHFLTVVARQLSERAKMECRVDIHPAARIGCPFVVDHGAGTVIGETVCVGEDCYFLQDVVLGTANIREHAAYNRHPKIGDDVIIAGSVRVYGNIKIGSGARIHGLAVVTHDIPPNAHVQVQTFLQIVDPRHRSSDPAMPVLLAVLPGPDGALTLYGRNLDRAAISLVNQNLQTLHPLSGHLTVLFQSDSEIRARIQSPLEIINDAPANVTDLELAGPSDTTNRAWGVCLTEKAQEQPGRVYFTIPNLHRHLLR